MKILVTGGAGFIGSHLTRELIKENYEVVVVDNLSTGRRENLPEGVNFFEADVRDKKTFEIIQKEKIEVIAHLAGQTMVDASIKDPMNDANQNITGIINILEASKCSAVKRVIFSSTAASYGDVDVNDLPILEKHSLNPMSCYGLSKVTAEKYLALYNSLYGIDYVILRFANVYGERQGDGGEGGVISIFTKKIANNENITIFGDGEQTRDFIYAGDIAKGIVAAVKTDNVNTAYNLSSETETSLRELVSLLSEIKGENIIPNYEKERKGDIRRSMLSAKKAARGLSWKAETKLFDGLKLTFGYFKSK